MNNEDLYRQMEEQEREDDLRYRQSLAPRQTGRAAKKEPDVMKALARFNRDFKPVFAARRRVRMGLGPTGNAIKDAWLKLTRKDKLPDESEIEVVAPDAGFVLSGPTIEEVQKEIAENPEKYADLRRVAPKVQPKAVDRRTSSNLPPPK
jgi:hypothetical protein